MEYRPTIGLEIHVELKTLTKMFCSCANDSGESRQNVNICPVCMAHPGTLPTVNREAVHHVLRVGAAVEGTIADYTEFDRKSYFYPDIPKGYQISQYEFPLISGGTLAGVPITRIHLEEDTAKSSHEGQNSLVDFNRAGVPLMELVTEPEIHDAETAANFARELQLLLRTLGVSDAELSRGEMRVEANISVSKDPNVFGTKVEVKNLNSFRSVERAIRYEVDRQSALIEEGGAVVQETRGWDEIGQKTFRQRTKEGSADYRYFPEPDLPKMRLSLIEEFSAANLRAELPELPSDRRIRYISLGIKEEDAAVLASAAERSKFFDEVIESTAGNKEATVSAANYIVSDLLGWYAKNGGKEFEHISAGELVKLIEMSLAGSLSSRGVKDALAELAARGGKAEEVVESLGLLQVNDEALLAETVEKLLAMHPGPVEEYRQGKEAALQFFVGQAMKATRGAGNPQLLAEMFKSKLSN